MSGPFVYVGTWTIKEGKVGDAKRFLEEHTDLVEANEPRLISFNVFLDEAVRRVCVVQVHPDAASMELHMEVIAEHLTGAAEYLETTEHEQYYGRKSSRLANIVNSSSCPPVREYSRIARPQLGCAPRLFERRAVANRR